MNQLCNRSVNAQSTHPAVRKDIESKIGAQAVSFSVDSSILGGLVLKVGDQVLDGSVAGKLESLRRSLK